MNPPEDDGIEGLPSALAAWRFAFALSIRAWPVASVTTAALTLAHGLVPLAQGAALGALTASRGEATSTWVLVLLAASLIASPVLQPFSYYFSTGYYYRFIRQTSQSLMRASLQPAGIEHLESPKFKNLYEHVSMNSWQLANLLLMASEIGVQLLSAGVAAVVLARTDAVLIIPLVAAVATGLLSARARKKAIERQRPAMQHSRVADALALLGTQHAAAKDLRMFGLADWLLGRHRRARNEVVRTLIGAEARTVPAGAFVGVLQALLLGGGLLLLVQRAAERGTSAAGVVLAAVLFRNALSSVESLGAYNSILTGTTFFAKRFLWLMRYDAPVVARPDPVPVPERLTDGIRLEGVSFSYPETEREILNDASVLLPAGSTVALVGDNGAGKSTIVKLLLRFYDPTEGRITVDGVDLRDLDVQQWRQRSSGALQDYVKFELLAGQSIGVGRLDQIEEREAVRLAAVGGGAAPVIEALPDQYDTQLGRTFPDGTDLSEGQWQKVAISRAQMRTEPLLVVLDEPTAALDARSEHDLFERYAEMAKAGRERGAVTVLVSHRFSTVQMADLIVVIDDGRVIEHGSHDDLLAAGGRYAELYGLQAQRYR